MSKLVRFAVVLYLSALSDLQAQIKLPDVIRRGRDAIQQGAAPAPKQPPIRRGEPVAAQPEPGQCQALVQWISILQREDPNVDFLHTAMGPKLLDQIVNLYRDESFIPLYGRSFSQTTTEDRLAFFKGVMIPCSRPQSQVSSTDQAVAKQYRDLLGRPFSFKGQAEFSGDYVLTGLTQRRTTLNWMQQVTQHLAQVPPTSQGFDELQTDLQRGQIDVDKLWPREKQAFLKVIADRQSVIAQEILNGVSVTANTEAAKGFDGVKAIAELYNAQDRYIRLLDPESKRQVQMQKEQALAAAVQSAAPGEKQKLAAMPANLQGAYAVAGWQRVFKAATQGLPVPPEAASLLTASERERRKFLTVGLPEFKALVAQHPKPGRDGMDALAMMDKLFPDPADTGLPEYRQYSSVLSTRMAALAKIAATQEAAAAKKKADDEARALARSSTVRQLPASTTKTKPEEQLQPAQADTVLTVSSLKTKGLENEQLLTRFYLGDFVNISLERDNILFDSIYNNYLVSFARQCDSSLPPDRVAITYTKCDQGYYWTGRYGLRKSSDICTHSVTLETGLYAAPAMYAAKIKLDRLVSANVLRDTVRLMNQGNSALSLVSRANSLEADLNSLVQINACKSPGLIRFQENLMLFALGKQPIPLSGEVDNSPKAVFRDSNFTKLLDDLVSEQSKSWAMNQYQRGSMSGVIVVSRDALGRPAKVFGRYLFNSKSQGSVNVDFSDGLPACLYFSDFPYTCRDANRRIAAAYAGGQYQ